jgi:hypothetical protein
MSGSSDENVNVNITADASGFQDGTQSAAQAATQFTAALQSSAGSLGAVGGAMQRATLSASDFAAALTAAGGNLAKIDTAALGLGSDRLAQAILAATAAERASGAELAHLASASEQAGAGFRSAAESADFFLKLLNPTPLQRLRALMGDALPEAFQMTQNATGGVINTLQRIEAEAKSAADAAHLFGTALGDIASPAQQLNALMNANVGSLTRTTETIHQAIGAQTGLGQGFVSAAESAAFFSQQISGLSTADLRAKLLDVAEGLTLTSTATQDAIATANRLDAGFKSAQDSASVFAAALGDTLSPTQQLLDLMGPLAESVTFTSVSTLQAIEGATGLGTTFQSAADSADVFARALGDIKTPAQQLVELMNENIGSLRLTTETANEAINAATGLGGGLKSAADSAAFFAAEINATLTPTATLRQRLADLTLATKVTTQTIQEAIGAGTGLDREFRSAAESAQVFAIALGDVQTPAQKLKTLMNTDLPEGAHKTQTGLAGIMREIVVVGHEAMNGRFSMIPGSLVTMAERSGGLMTKLGELATSFTFMGGVAVGAVAAVTLAIVAMIARAVEAANSIRQIGNAAVLMGQDTARARAEAAGLNDQLKQTGVGQTEALKVAGGLQTLTSATQAQRAQLADLAIAFSKSLGETPEKATERLVAALDKGAGGVRTLMDEYHLWDAQNGLVQRSQLKLAEDTHDSSAAMGIAIGALTTRFQEYVTAAQKFRESGADMEFQAGPAQAMALPEAPQRAESPQVAQQRDETIAHTQDLNKLLGLQHDLAAAQAQYAAAGTDAERAIAAAAEHNIQVQIQLNRVQGDSTWAQEQEAALNQVLTSVAAHATSVKGLAIDENKARVTFWEAASKQIGLTEGELNVALANLSRARLALTKENLAGAAQAAKQSLAEKLAALSEEQAANRADYAMVMQIEAQKLALIKAAHGSASKDYESELAKEDNLRRQHATQQANEEEKYLASERTAMEKETAAVKSALDAEVAEHKIGKEKELQILQQFTAQQQQVMLAGEQALLVTLGNEPALYKATLDKITDLKEQFAAQDAKINTQIAQEQAASWQKTIAPVESAISGQVSSVLRGQETISMAVQKAAGNIVISYAQMATQAALKWAAGKAYELLINNSTETAKTAATAAATLTREGIDTTATTTQNTALLAQLAHWITGETAKTTATVAGNTARTAANTAATAAGSAQEVAVGSASVMNSAYQAAAHTYASVSAIPYVGWLLAPGAAAAAFAAVAAFDSLTALDVGAWNLPSDMPAQLHAGEMVVPANFADGLRGAMGGGGGTGGAGGGQTLNYSPNIAGGHSADMAGMMRQQSASFKSYLWHATRNGALQLPHGRG